ncbi:MAG: GNAT family N-acetyltransferase [Nanoarchaeota archaeon]|nr:GNAT family N-acetyltransferase [Nanoarchaeota archaeon]
MSFHFTFQTVDGTRDIGRLVDFLAKQDLGYPHYDEWVQRAENELAAGYKVPIIAVSDGQIVGDVLYQPHKQIPRLREIKNLRVHPDLRRRDFAHFMLRQAEAEHPEQYDAIICDTRADQREIIGLLTFSGYVPVATVPLYGDDLPDVTLVKVFDKRIESGIMVKAQNLILGKN